MFKATETPQRSSPEETRQRILAAARETLGLKGSHGTTTREVADRAGVNEATLFRHFGSKQSLLVAMREHYCDVAALEHVLTEVSGNLDSDLRRVGGAIVAGITRNEDLIRVSMAEESGNPEASEVTWRGPAKIHEALIRYMADNVERGSIRGEPEALARFFMGMLFAHVIARKLWHSRRASQEAIVDFCVDVFLNGVRSK